MVWAMIIEILWALYNRQYWPPKAKLHFPLHDAVVQILTYRFLLYVIVEAVLAVVPHEVAHTHAALDAVSDVPSRLGSLI